MVLATGPGNRPAVWVWTTTTGRFSFRPVQKHDTLTLGGPNLDPYPSTRGFRRVLDRLVAFNLEFCIPGFTFMVAFRYATV
jgi:hypothetical protein